MLKKLVLWSLGVLVLLVAGVAGVGAWLPQAHVASRGADFQQPPATLYEIVHDVARYPEWWAEVSRVEMLEPVEGRVRFREHTATGPIVMEIVEARPGARLVTRIADPDQPFGGTWTFEIAPSAAGARLTITERGEVYNPIFRFLSRFVFGYTGTMESFLRGLGVRVGQAVTIT
jgi:hypothetical protein